MLSSTALVFPLCRAAQFGLAVEDLGFPSSLAAEVFIELDEDGGGSVTCAEMMSALHARSFAVSSDTKAFLADLAFVDTAASVGSKERYAKVAASLFAGTNRINAIDADTLRSQLQSRILAAGVRASDLYVVMLDGKPHLTLDVFTKAIMRFGYAGPLELIPAIFGQVETDGSDVIGISELHAWINAPSSTVFTDRLNAARKCSIKDCRVDGLVGLHAILGGEACTAEVLQTELQTMLVRLDVTPLDLVRAWDKNGDGQLSFKEFLVMIKRLVHPEGINELDLWDLDLRSLVQTIFDQIAGADKTIDLIEVQRWLGKAWKKTPAPKPKPAQPRRAPTLYMSAMDRTKENMRQGDDVPSRQRRSAPRRPLTFTASTPALPPKPPPKPVVRTVIDPSVHDFLSDICRLAQSGNNSRDQREAMARRIERFQLARPEDKYAEAELSK